MASKVVARTEGRTDPTWHRSDIDANTVYITTEEKLKLFMTLACLVPIDWQYILFRGMLAVNPKTKRWLHDDVGFFMPRQQGKTFLMILRVLFGIIVLKEKIIYSTYDNKQAQSFLRELRKVINKSPYLKSHIPDKLIRNNGEAGIYLSTTPDPETKAFGELICISRADSKSDPGRGEPNVSLVIYDEAQKVRDNHIDGLDSTLATAKRPQSIYCGTPPREGESYGEWFLDYRDNVRQEAKEGIPGVYWSEWTIDKVPSRTDKRWWYETNPSLNKKRGDGRGLTEAALTAATRKYTDERFAVERLGYMAVRSHSDLIKYPTWAALRDESFERPRETTEKLAVALKINQVGTRATLCYASSDPSRDTFVKVLLSLELADPTWGNKMAKAIKKLYDAPKCVSIVIDGYKMDGPVMEALSAMGAWILLPKNRSELYKQGKIEYADSRLVATASSAFVEGVRNRELIHKDPDSGILSRSVANVKKRDVKGQPDGYGLGSSKPETDAHALEAAAVAYYKARAAAADTYGDLLDTNETVYKKSVWKV